MKFLTNIGITGVVGLCLGLMLPWWAIAIAGFLGGFFFDKGGVHDFFAGFCAGFLLWGIMAFIIASGTASPLPGRMAEIFFLGNSAKGAVLLTGLVGGITAGLGSLTGGHLRRMINPGRDGIE